MGQMRKIILIQKLKFISKNYEVWIQSFCLCKYHFNKNKELLFKKIQIFMPFLFLMSNDDFLTWLMNKGVKIITFVIHSPKIFETGFWKI